MYPEQWEPDPSYVPGEWLELADDDGNIALRLLKWLALVGDEGLTSLKLLTEYDGSDATLSDRLESAIAALMLEDAGAEGRNSVQVTLADGSEAERADIVYEDDDGAIVRRVQVARRGSLTFVLVLSTPATELERQQETFETVLASFSSFPPAPYGIPRNRAFTMPLGAPVSLDPVTLNETTSKFFVNNLFSGLVRLGEDLDVEPDLAGRWEVDEAGVVYTFTLRDGITFHDGRPITANDFKYSIERATDPELDSDTAPLYLGDILGVREKLNGEATEVSGVEAVDERTVRITIDSPKEYFLAKLSYPSGAVVDRQTVEQLGPDGWTGDEINGSGPYKLLRWDHEEVVILQRFDDYHTPVALEYLISPNDALTLPGATGMDMYLTDAWDGMYAGFNLLYWLDWFRGDAVLSEQLGEYDQLTSYFVAMDGTRPPFDDPKVRRAFAMALDRERYIEEVSGGNLEPAIGLLPPGIPGYSDTLEGIPFDPEMARQLLAESQYADNLPRIIYTAFDSGGQPSRIVRFMVDAWRKELGVEVQVVLLPLETYYYELEEAAGHLYTYGWAADYPDPENFLDLILHSENRGSRYVNPTFDELLEKARVEQDREIRLGLYRQAEQLLMDDAGIIPLYHTKEYVFVRPHVQGFTISPFGQPDVTGITLQTIAR